MKIAASLLRTSMVLIILFTLFLGVAYPALVLVVAQGVFPNKANGSLLIKDHKVIGSALLAQEFSKPKYFWSRPSATTPPYNAAASSASNLNPANTVLQQSVKARLAALQHGSDNKNKVPVDMVTASGSGLDPHISLAAAEYQIPRVATARGMKESELRALVEKYTQRWLDISYVNVVQLNLALEK